MFHSLCDIFKTQQQLIYPLQQYLVILGNSRNTTHHIPRFINNSVANLHSPQNIYFLAHLGHKRALAFIFPFCLYRISRKQQDRLPFLKSLSTLTIVEKTGIMPFRPVIDGTLIRDTAEEVYKSHLASGVDFLMGCNSHEGAMFTIGPLKIKSFKNIEEAKVLVKRLLRESFWGSVKDQDAFAEEVIQEYLLSRNVSDLEELQKGMVDLLGDVWFSVPTIETADRHSGKKFNDKIKSIEIK